MKSMRFVRLITIALWLATVCCISTASAQNESSPTLLIVGDSISAGYGLPLGQGWVNLLTQNSHKTAPCWQIVNRSISGDTTSGGLARLPQLIQQYRPQIVMIELGGNDALQGLDPTLIQHNLFAMTKLAKAASARVIIIEPPILPNYGPDYAKALAQVYTVASKDNHSSLITTFFAGLTPPPSQDFQDDNIHPSLRAQPILLKNVLPTLNPLLTCNAT